MEKNGNEGSQPALRPLSSVDLEALIISLVEKGIVSAEAINAEVDQIRFKAGGQTADVINKSEKVLAPETKEAILNTLKSRFEANMNRHKGMKWSDLMDKLESRDDKEEKLWSINELEKAGHELDVIGKDDNTGEFLFFSCSAEAPVGHRNLLYDREAQESRMKNNPDEKSSGNATDIAVSLNAVLGSEKQYRYLQTLGKFDVDTRVWLQTPANIRKTGNALQGVRNRGGISVIPVNATVYRNDRGLRVALTV